MLKARQVVKECYILQERLGEDSFFELWRATTIFSAAQFLVRFLKEGAGLEGRFPEFRERAMRCYPVVAPSVMDFVEVEGAWERPFITSPYDGQTALSGLLGERRRFSLEHICRFVAELAQGLDAFHKQGIVYGCLNAENVLVRASSDRVEEIRVQKPGYLPFLPLLGEGDRAAALANHAYLAPELKAALGQEGGAPSDAERGAPRGGAPDERADIYSLGIHLATFLFGASPFGPRSKKLRSGSVSLSHVANGLARRALPEQVIRIALRSLRRDPELRYPRTIDLISDLHKVMDERRLEMIKNGLEDPFAELEKLNKSDERLEASQALKRLDTAGYFQALSEAQLSSPAPRRPSIFLPREDDEEMRAIEALESAELEAEAEDDPSLTIDDYIAEAFKAAGRDLEIVARKRKGSPVAVAKLERGESSMGGGEGPRPTAAEPGPAGGTASYWASVVAYEPGLSVAAKPSPSPAASRPSPPATIEEPEPAAEPAMHVSPNASTGLPPIASTVPVVSPSPEEQPQEEPPRKEPRHEAAIVSEMAADQAPRRRRGKPIASVPVDSGGIEWRSESAPTEAVVAGMEDAFRRSFRGRGAFRFIQEPPPGRAAAAFAAAFAGFARSGLVVDARDLPRRADATDLLRALRPAIRAALEGESRASLALLARRLAASDPGRAFGAAPLGELLYGEDSEEPDPELVEAPDYSARLARALAALGRRKRPLVLAIRGAEGIGPSTHAILVELARLAPELPLCGFAFFKPGEVEPWHVLSRLGGEKPEPRRREARAAKGARPA
jgi:serine/threonine protein kinase